MRDTGHGTRDTRHEMRDARCEDRQLLLVSCLLVSCLLVSCLLLSRHRLFDQLIAFGGEFVEGLLGG